jgi:lysophospholipase L1-like esterase
MHNTVVLRLTAGFLLTIAFVPGLAAAEKTRTDFRFSFGPGAAVPGFISVGADTMYSDERGYGFEPFTTIPAPGTGKPAPNTPPAIQGIDRKTGGALHSHFVTSDRPFLFSVAVPPGNYRVTLVLGDMDDESASTVKAESRMLMLLHIHSRAGGFATRSFLVIVHDPKISTGGEVKLDARENGVCHWDNKLTLEFSGARPALCSMEVHKVDDAITVFLCGDSTVTSQVREPYGTWGQMLPRWFDDHVAVADYAESGETLKGFKNERRWDKVLGEVKKGDYVFLQFGHNDLNKSGRNAIWPSNDPAGDWSLTYSEANTDYKRLLMEYATEVKMKGAIPVIVTPMTKIQSKTGEINAAGLGDYPKAAVEASKEAAVACIDLNAMSMEVVKGFGPEAARQAYVDGQHTTSYGGYLLSRCIVEGIRQNKLALSLYFVGDVGKFDPLHPEPSLDDFNKEPELKKPEIAKPEAKSPAKQPTKPQAGGNSGK